MYCSAKLPLNDSTDDRQAKVVGRLQRMCEGSYRPCGYLGSGGDREQMGTAADRGLNFVSHAGRSTQVAEAGDGVGRHVSNQGIGVLHPSDMRLPNEAYGKALPVMLLRAAATAIQKRRRQAGVGAPAYLLRSSVGSGGRTTRRPSMGKSFNSMLKTRADSILGEALVRDCERVRVAVNPTWRQTRGARLCRIARAAAR